MSSPELKVKITAVAELRGLKETERDLIRQVAVAKATGGAYKELEARLVGVQSAIAKRGLLGNATSELTGFAEQIPVVGSLMRSLNGGVGLASAALAGLAGALGVAKGALAAFSRIEDLQTTFVTLLGSVDAAKKRIAELSKFAAETPFTLPEIARGEKPIGKLAITDDEILLPSVARMRVKAIRRDTETRTVWIELQERGMR